LIDLRIREYCCTLPPVTIHPIKKASVPMAFTRSIGMSLLAVWLIISGLVGLLGLSFQGLGMLMAILALAAGVLILAGR
jgi:hypothetical protein